MKKMLLFGMLLNLFTSTLIHAHAHPEEHLSLSQPDHTHTWLVVLVMVVIAGACSVLARVDRVMKRYAKKMKDQNKPLKHMDH